MEIVSLVLVAMFIEAVVTAIKPLWSRDADGKRLSAAEIVSIVLGVVLAVASKINMLEGLVKLETPDWVQYLFYVMTGIALGRGPSFLFDLWTRIKVWQGQELIPGEPLTAEMGIDLEITNWGLRQLQDFCAINGIPCAGCTTREDYIKAIEGLGSPKAPEPPDSGGAE